MFNPFERTVAWRYLRSRGGEGVVSIIALFSFLGIMLGVATLIIVMSVMNGFREELFGNILKFNGNMMVRVLRPGLPGMPSLDAVRATIEADPQVKNVATIIEGQAMAIFPPASQGGVAKGLSSQSPARGLMVRGIAPDDFAKQRLVADTLMMEEKPLMDANTILVGQALAASAGLVPGSMVKLVVPNMTPSAFGFMPRYKEFKVGGIFATDNWTYDMNYVFMPLDVAEKFFGSTQPEIQVFLATIDDGDPFADRLKKIYGPRVVITDWRQANQAFFQAIIIERNVMFIILTLIVVVAAFNIISGLVMLVKDKTKAIAILRTMGASRGSVLRIFLLTGASIGVVGTACGGVLGLVIAHNIEGIRQFLQSVTGLRLFQEEIYFLTRIPAIVNPYEVISVIGMALGLTFLATLYPSWKAAKLDPIQALRYE